MIDETAGDAGPSQPSEQLAEGLRRAYDAPIMTSVPSEATIGDVEESLDDLMAKMKSM